MESVKILKSSGEIFYDDNNTCWEADIFFNVANKEILIYRNY